MYKVRLIFLSFSFLFCFLLGVGLSSNLNPNLGSSSDSNSDLLWEYDVGPDPQDPKIFELVDLMAEVPPLPEICPAFGLGGFFRKDWGPIFLGFQGVGEDGTLWGRNAVEVLVIGQDGVPLAEAAGRLGVSRFAGFSWSLARYFGYSRVGFVNAFPYGVDGMYSSKGVPAGYTTRDGRRVDIRVNFVDSKLWYLGMDMRGPLAPWRNSFYDWVFERQSDSLSLVLVFGEAARDALAVYLRSKGVSVPLRFLPDAEVALKVPRVVMDLAQVGGYRLEALDYEGKFSLQGMKVGGRELSRPVYVLCFPHHTHLHRVSAKDLEALNRVLRYYSQRVSTEGWSGASGSAFSMGQAYDYVREDMPWEQMRRYFDFGVSRNRYGFEGKASRRGFEPMTLALGSREAKTDEQALYSVRRRPCYFGPLSGYSLGRPIGPERFVWDRGPSKDWGDLFLMAEEAQLFAPKRKGGFRLGVGPSVGLFGHYRGDLVSPRVVVLSDPLGYDDMMTSRALTGLRGQYLQGLMRRVGVPEHYLVLKTVPSAMDGVDSEDWRWVLSRLSGYLDALVGKISESFGKDVVWVADGIWAEEELSKRGIDFVSLPRTGNHSEDMSRGYESIVDRDFGFLKGLEVKGGGVFPEPIPRSHLPFFSRFWEGASGDSVVSDLGLDPRRSFFFVLPTSVWEQSLNGVGGQWFEKYLNFLTVLGYSPSVLEEEGDF